ncbi:MAG: hypothetical protein QOH80_1300 [Actinomycetota bacterium]|jgi:hypothetical protein|nr:hypothetical protein [Actinomycetota bacterium]
MTTFELEKYLPIGARARSRPFILGELFIISILVFVYDHIRDLADAHRAASIASARWIMQAEQQLHIDVELPSNLWLSAHHELAELSSWYYQVAHLTVTLLVLAYCYWRRPDTYRSARNALVSINAIGLVIFWLVPVAPPRLLPGYGFIDTTIMSGVANAAGSAANPYAAMPSLHLAWAAWTAVVAWRMFPGIWARVAWAAYPVLTTLVVVGTGNHYLLDVFAGVAVAVVAALLTGLIGPRLRDSERSPQGFQFDVTGAR